MYIPLSLHQEYHPTDNLWLKSSGHFLIYISLVILNYENVILSWIKSNYFNVFLKIKLINKHSVFFSFLFSWIRLLEKNALCYWLVEWNLLFGFLIMSLSSCLAIYQVGRAKPFQLLVKKKKKKSVKIQLEDISAPYFFRVSQFQIKVRYYITKFLGKIKLLRQLYGIPVSRG